MTENMTLAELNAENERLARLINKRVQRLETAQYEGVRISSKSTRKYNTQVVRGQITSIANELNLQTATGTIASRRARNIKSISTARKINAKLTQIRDSAASSVAAIRASERARKSTFERMARTKLSWSEYDELADLMSRSSSSHADSGQIFDAYTKYVRSTNHRQPMTDYIKQILLDSATPYLDISDLFEDADDDDGYDEDYGYDD